MITIIPELSDFKIWLNVNTVSALNLKFEFNFCGVIQKGCVFVIPKLQSTKISSSTARKIW
jgi:hypothetical protein